MTKQDTRRQIEGVDGEREHVVLGLRITCSDASVTELVYFKYYDGIPDLIIQDFVGVSVVSERDDAMLGEERERRGGRKKDLQLHQRAGIAHSREPSNPCH